jgi:hypothetical protein
MSGSSSTTSTVSGIGGSVAHRTLPPSRFSESLQHPFQAWSPAHAEIITMRSLPTGVTAATAAALAALAVTVAVPALGDSGEKGMEESTIRACLKDHNVAVPEGDGRVLKMWIIGPHTGAEEAAIKDCGLLAPPKPGDVHGSGPDEAKLRTCLKDHSVAVDDPDLKHWVIGDHSPAETAALKACGLAGVTKAGPDGGPCGDKPDRAGAPADRMKRVAPAPSAASSGT